MFIYFMVPETKGRSLEEIDEMFANRVPVRGFKQYECLSSETARELAKKDHELDAVEPTVSITERVDKQQNMSA